LKLNPTGLDRLGGLPVLMDIFRLIVNELESKRSVKRLGVSGASS
jgi:hypothetical protein